MKLSLADRAAAYNSAFAQYPDSKLHLESRMLCGIWMGGQNYKNGSSLYGAYPPSYLPRVLALFPDIERKRILHLFAGSVEPDDWTRVDLVLRTPSARRFAKIDAHHLSRYFSKGQFDLVLADPPYSEADSARYGTPMPNRKTVVHEIARILRKGTYLVWLDTVWPMFRKDEFDLVGAIGLLRSTNHRDRIAKIFQRV